MIRLALIATFALFIAGCETTSTTVIDRKLITVLPSEALYRCPVLKSLPNADHLTDIQVARLIETLYYNNITCKHSIDQIRAFLLKSAAATR